MYKLSYEKCVCFIFLVIVAILSCSGFRIDNLAMTDISKKNHHTSFSVFNSQNSLLERLYADAMESSGSRDKRFSERRHRIRHSKNHQAPLNERHPSNTLAFQNDRSATTESASSAVERSQRSSQRRKSRRPCQEQDVGRKAYLADIVVLARAESMSSSHFANRSVTFKIIDLLKSSSMPVDDQIRLTFSNDTKGRNCAKEEQYADNDERSRGLVKAKIVQSKEYVLFLRAYEGHDYSVLGMPVEVKEKNRVRLKQIIQNVTRRGFEPTLEKVTLRRKSGREHEKILRLNCTAKGFPTPYLSWMKNGKVLSSSKNVRITYKKKRTTQLVIKEGLVSEASNYTCVAVSVNRNELSETYEHLRAATTTTTSPPILEKECPSHLKAVFCDNGGTCKYSEAMMEPYCVCADGFTGNRCERKQPSSQPNQNVTETSMGQNEEKN